MRYKAFIESLFEVMCKQGIRASWAHVKSRIFSDSKFVIYSKDNPMVSLKEPEAAVFKEIHLKEATGIISVSREFSDNLDRSNFSRNAKCYASFIGGEISGLGWLFYPSMIASALGFGADTAYLGNFYILDKFRRQGLYSYMLQYIMDANKDRFRSFLIQTGVDNIASVRGIEKAGFVRKGIYQCRIRFGMIRIRKLD